MILSGLELTLMVAHGVQMVFLRWNLSVECAAAFVLFFLVLRFNKALDVIVVEGLSTGWKSNCPTNSPSQTWAGIRLLVFSCFVMFCPSSKSTACCCGCQTGQKQHLCSMALAHGLASAQRAETKTHHQHLLQAPPNIATLFGFWVQSH